MRQNRYRRSLLALALISAIGAVGCGDDGIQVIEEIQFAGSLGVDLGTMTRKASGLYIKDEVVGTGTIAAAGDSVSVQYQGWLANGDLFDSGVFPFTLGARRAIDGFDEGVTGMAVGGTRLIVIPPSLGYGDRGQGSIPPGAVLVFRLTLLSVG